MTGEVFIPVTHIAELTAAATDLPHPVLDFSGLDIGEAESGCQVARHLARVGNRFVGRQLPRACLTEAQFPARQNFQVRITDGA
jgi:hypothetical protein